MFDDFEASNPNDWKIGSYAYEGATINSSMDGSYRWHARAETHFVVWGHPNQLNGWETPEAFYLSVDYRQITGPETAVAGLVFRGSGSEMNVFRVRGDQRYSISYWQGGAKGWDVLVPWTRTTAICPGEVNRLVVMGDGARYIFLINGQFVGELEDKRHSSGFAGLAIELFEPGDLAIFEFDNLELRHPLAADVQVSGHSAQANAISAQDGLTTTFPHNLLEPRVLEMFRRLVVCPEISAGFIPHAISGTVPLPELDRSRHAAAPSLFKSPLSFRIV
jgi:hypothetical protein